jgi:hypothetical protein
MRMSGPPDLPAATAPIAAPRSRSQQEFYDNNCC